MRRLFLLFVALAACSRTSSDRAHAPDSTLVLTCGGAVDTIPFRQVDLGAAAQTRSGRPTRELIQTADEWAARGAAITDSAPLPTLNFTDSIVLIVASPVFDSSVRSMEFDPIGGCRFTRDIVVPIRLDVIAEKSDSASRSVRAIQIARDDWKGRPFTFVDTPLPAGR